MNKCLGNAYVQIIQNPASPTGYYKYNIFTTSGIATFTGPSASATDFSYVLVGGGGAGGHFNDTYQGGGGGGAGGFIKDYNAPNLPAGNYTVSIGAGGQAAFDNPGGTNSPYPPTGGPGGAPWPQQASSGSNSSFGPTPVGTIIAYGGGKAGQAHFGTPYPSYTYPVPSPNYFGSPGGSGGGGTCNGPSRSYPNSSPTRRHPGGTGRSYPSPNQQGYPGGDAGTYPNFTGTQPGGGGGGAGGSGQSQSFYTGTPTRQYQNSGGSGGNGQSNPEFPGPGLALIPGFPNDLASAMGTSGYLAGGGGSGIYTYPTVYRYAPPPSAFEPWTPRADGGVGGGGDGYFYAGPPPAPTWPNPNADTFRNAAAGVQNTGGGGGGGPVPGGPNGDIPTPAPGTFYGAPGGSGVMMIRYAHPGS